MPRWYSTKGRFGLVGCMRSKSPREAIASGYLPEQVVGARDAAAPPPRRWGRTGTARGAACSARRRTPRPRRRRPRSPRSTDLRRGICGFFFPLQPATRSTATSSAATQRRRMIVATVLKGPGQSTTEPRLGHLAAAVVPRLERQRAARASRAAAQVSERDQVVRAVARGRARRGSRSRGKARRSRRPRPSPRGRTPCRADAGARRGRSTRRYRWSCISTPRKNISSEMPEHTGEHQYLPDAEGRPEPGLERVPRAASDRGARGRAAPHGAVTRRQRRREEQPGADARREGPEGRAGARRPGRSRAPGSTSRTPGAGSCWRRARSG
jgi:hypothetical protein